MSDAVFNRQANFTDGAYVHVAVYEPSSVDPKNIIIGLRAGEGYEYHNIGMTRAQAKRLRDLLNAAIVVDEASFLAPPEAVIEGPANDNDVWDTQVAAARACTDPDCQVCEIEPEERGRRRMEGWRRECAHQWEPDAESYGLIDRCKFCGEERA